MSAFRKKPSRESRVNPYSYYKGDKNNFSRSSRVKDSKKSSRKLRSIVRRASIFRIVAVLIGIGLFLYLTSASTIPIIRFGSVGENARDTTVYRSEIQGLLEKSIFNRSKLLFDYRGAQEAIKKQFPEIESVEISFDVVGRKPVVKLMTLKPAYIFQTRGLSWVVDSRGIAMGLQSELNESFSTSLQVVTDEVGASASIGTALMSTKQTGFLDRIIELLEKQLTVVTEVYLTENPKEIVIKVSGDDWRYKLNIDERASEQGGALLAARATLEANGNVPAEYVDLRAGEKVYWK